jgi:homoserine O-succinyltransferase
MAVHKTVDGQRDRLLGDLENPFWDVDSRDYQVVQPGLKKFKLLGVKIIALEKTRDHVEYERAWLSVFLMKW